MGKGKFSPASFQNYGHATQNERKILWNSPLMGETVLFVTIFDHNSGDTLDESVHKSCQAERMRSSKRIVFS